ncbi:hypothetical protein [Rhizobium sp. GN54]|uniref:hypothetical protein n=1 Tax=Rhizobium sp. GN54 TaxID=2898150 RepID=UPI001E3CC974|nr:hypothetical protein [Rhizobium sp. GN54]MCD2183309.1 hypothetical protein [Rhizobium sp. GN54]
MTGGITRRQSLGLFAGATIPPTAAVAVAAVTTSPQERFEYHLAELKKAAEELDPMIETWFVDRPHDDDDNRSVAITARRRTGQYEGDGVYESGRPSATGVWSRYEVRLRADIIDGQRTFDLKSAMDRRVQTETCLRTFIGRKIGGLNL